MQLNSALVAFVVSLIPSAVARSIPLNSRYRTISVGSHKSDPQEHPIAGKYCMRTHDLSPLLESNLQTPLLVKSLGIEGLHHLLGVYIVNSPYTRTCIYPQPTCPTVDVYGFLCIPPLASVDASPAFEGNPCQCEPPAAYYTNRRRLAKQGHPSAISRAYSPNETACGKTGGSADAFECVGTETHPDKCGGCAVFSVVEGHHYGSRLAGADCATVSHADAASCISDGCAAQSCLAMWSIDDDDATRTSVEDQMSDAPSSKNMTGVDHVEPYTRQTPHTHLLGRRDAPTSANVEPYTRQTPHTHLLGRRDAPTSAKSDRTTAFGSEHIKEDWTRLPDYRRHLA